MTRTLIVLLLAASFFACSNRRLTETAEQIPQQRGTLRILCYNVRNGMGMDNQVSYERIAGVINRVGPQVVALQELDSATERSKGIYVLGRLSELTKMHATYGAAIPYKGGKYGVGVLSKEKPLGFTSFPLPGKEEQRTLLMVEFRDYVLFCSHFSLTEADRLASAAIINERKQQFHKKVFLAGDLNATPASPVITALKEDWELLSGEDFTYSAADPTRCIDYIFGAKGHSYEVVRKEVLREPLASDHLPLYVDVR